MSKLVNTPTGKTTVMFVGGNDNQTEFKEHDVGYIDGHVQAADKRPYCVFVRHSDGYIDLCAYHKLQAVRDEPTK